ncbi:hypothetical protein SC449_07780, partial [Legionella pneumophila serogroup 1]
CCHCQRSEAIQNDILLEFCTGLLHFVRNDGIYMPHERLLKNYELIFALLAQCPPYPLLAGIAPYHV